MKVLWVCNLVLPEIAEKLNMAASNKEGWVAGLLYEMLSGEFRGGNTDLQIQLSFPVPYSCCDADSGICSGEVEVMGNKLEYFGFYEDVQNPERYENALEGRMELILKRAKPDMVHCFGTEYPHTLAVCKVIEDKSKVLVGIQGICALLAEAYYADLPENVVKSWTLRDVLRKDSIARQREKFCLRGIHETEAIRLAGNITGRTPWDREHCLSLNPNARYFSVNENLRPIFYEKQWKEADCVPHSIFMSQGDYPIKGLHYMLQAMPGILGKYPDATLSLAGNSLVAYETWKDKLKLSAYGKYLRSLIKKYGLEEKVRFLGRMSGEEMLQQYMKSHLFVCCSSLENSSNSLGEAMLLGMPCVCADVGGLPGIFEGGKDGIMYEGFRTGEKMTNSVNEQPDDQIPLKKLSKKSNSCKKHKNNTCNDKIATGTKMENISNSLKNAVLNMWSDSKRMQEYGENARNHAKITHDKLINCSKMVEIYAEITSDLRV